MKLFKVAVEVDGRSIESEVRAGVLASVETGILKDESEIPEHKINLILDDSSNEPTAWVQVIKIDEKLNQKVINEGLAGNSELLLDAITGEKSSCKVAISEIEVEEKDLKECHKITSLKTRRCCTAYGRGCYVRCCNSCCSDPTRCPGASCCA